jgi:FkbM family methyltransferase
LYNSLRAKRKREGRSKRRDRLHHRNQFSWKHRLIAALSRRLNLTYTVRSGLARGMKRRGGLGFIPWIAETGEIRFLRNLDLDGAVVYDIGAFEGIMTLFFSTRAMHVVSFEPDPVSRKRLLANLVLNRISNVTVRDAGLSNVTAATKLVYDPPMPSAASGSGPLALQSRNTASSQVEVEMRVARLDGEVRDQSLPPPDFIKIDAAGVELHVLEGAEETLKHWRPRLYIELHGAEDADKRQNAHDVVALLSAWGYGEILDVETGQKVNSLDVGRPSHIFCTCPRRI